MSFISQQPNGRYCRFSTIVDCPTHINMTREDYLANVTETVSTVEQGQTIIEHHLISFDEMKRLFVPNNMSRKEFKRIMKLMTDHCEGNYEVT